MFSFRTSIELFTNSSNGEENMNLPLLEELPSRTLIRIVAWLRKHYKIKNRFQLKLKRRKIPKKFNGLKWNLERWVLVVCVWQ
jgi:hypothetical protein